MTSMYEQRWQSTCQFEFFFYGLFESAGISLSWGVQINQSRACKMDFFFSHIHQGGPPPGKTRAREKKEEKKKKRKKKKKKGVKRKEKSGQHRDWIGAAVNRNL